MDTLANLLLREAYRPKSPLYGAGLQRSLIAARRFVLDDGMAAFMADLSTVPFQVAHVRRPAVLDSLRHGARLPHAVTWIEFSGHAFRDRLNQTETSHDAWGNKLAGIHNVPPRWGWLLEEHPQMPQAIAIHEYMDLGGGIGAGLPFHWVWNTMDDPLPWTADFHAGEIAHGISGYHCPQIGVVYDQPIPRQRRVEVKWDYDTGLSPYTTDTLVIEMGGTVRYALALLATLNDVPATVTEVKTDRGFVARGAYRKYLGHNVVKLTVPARADTRRLARKLVAMARQRNHPVRGHWRLYQRGEGALCAPNTHVWPAADLKGHAQCLHCTAWRTWIEAHRRGDATLGYTDHDYAVTHERKHDDPLPHQRHDASTLSIGTQPSVEAHVHSLRPDASEPPSQPVPDAGLHR
jgi:hypothetical protein